MNEAELRTLLNQPENPKLEFKREFYQIHHEDQQVRKQQWGELIKDILALANGNVGFAGKVGYLVIGVDEQRHLYDCTEVSINKQQILQRVNHYYQPHLPDLQVESVSIDGKKLIVIIIPPTPYLHETTQEIQTSNKRVFPAQITFVRAGDSIVTASEAVREAIKKEKASSPNVRAIQSLQDRIDSIDANLAAKRYELENTFDEKIKHQILSEIQELKIRKDF
ncbi:ATP-binding protein [Chloroflexus sp.]|uniref:AlbA family DNA-binding domain-containing protein n=1 Tax=Chloroflexus sp. TaxID=1904827 RepID=UPI002ACD5A77|nr:ATP-binding protein [Chloroflexus sp.]